MSSDLSQIPLFSCLTEPERETLARHTHTRSYGKNTIIISEGDLSDALYLVDEGKVKIYISDEDGREMLLNILEGGDYFGELSLIDQSPRSASAMTMTDTRLSMIAARDFRTVLGENPEIALKLITELAGRMRNLTQTVRRLALLDVYGRVTTTLLSLATEVDGTRRVEPKLTQQEIANMVGASREMVSRILKDLKTGGYLEIGKDAIVIRKQLPAKW